MNTARKKIFLEDEVYNKLSEQSVCIEIAYQKEIVYKIDITENKEESEQLDAFAGKVFQELEEYFSGQCKEFTFLYAFPKGTEFQNRVWHEIEKIPYGETISYTELAARAGRPRACRGAARACHDNPIPFCVPCHRVIAKNGAMQGYAYGTAIKKALLDLEKMRNSNDNR